jgi:uncharacterized protein YdeI (YjbR/CyaY-like superfamily)
MNSQTLLPNAVTLPQDLRAALECHTSVRAIIENLPPRHLAAYLGWIAEPTKPELRAQRIALTIYRLLEAETAAA